MTQLSQAQIELVSIIYKMYHLHHFCGCAGICGHVARVAVPSATKRSKILPQHRICTAFTHTSSYPLARQQARWPASETETAKKDFVHSQWQWSSPDDVTRMTHQAVTILCGHKAFLLSRNSPVTTWLGAARRDP